MVVEEFRFEAATAPINWRRISHTNVSQLARLGDVSALRLFLADVAVGDVDDGYVQLDHTSQRAAFKAEQLMSQYLLHSQHVLAKQKAAFDHGAKRYAAHERRARKKALARRERLRLLEEECAKQDRILRTYHALLQKTDPDLANRLAQDTEGRIIVRPDDGRDDDEESAFASTAGPAPFVDDGDDDDDDDAPYSTSDEDTASNTGERSGGGFEETERGRLPFKRTLQTLQWSRAPAQAADRFSKTT